MKNNSLPILILLISSITLSSCATLFTGTKDTVHFESTPTGAKVQVDGIDRGKTPCDVRVKRRAGGGAMATYKMEGYESRTFELQTSFNGVAALNLLNILFWAIDIGTGSINKYYPKYYNMELEQQKK